MEILTSVVHCDSMNGSDILQILYLPCEYWSQASSLSQSVTNKNVTKKQKNLVVLKTVSDLTLKTAGSFISFHIPSTLLELKSLTRSVHHERALDCVKSGKTQGPGHTSPKEDKELCIEQCIKTYE